MARHKLASPNYVLRVNANGFYEVRWTDLATGKTKKKTTGTKDQREAEARQGAVIAGISTPAKLKVLRISPIIDAFVAAKPREITSLRHVKERLGYLEPAKLNDAVAASYANWRQSKDDLSNATVRRDLEMLRAALHWGTRNGLGYTMADIGAFKMPLEKPPAKDRWLTREECRELVYKGCGDALHLRLFIRIALAVGARRQAILQLTWNRVNIPSGNPLRWVIDDVLEIEYEKLIEPVILDFGQGVGKKRRVRHVPVGDNAALYRDLVAAKAVAKTDHVIEWDGKPIADVKTALNKAYKRAGIEDASGAHLLRHTCCTLLVMSGLSYVQVGKIVGASAKVIEDTYGHHSTAFLQAAGAATAF